MRKIAITILVLIAVIAVSCSFAPQQSPIDQSRPPFFTSDEHDAFLRMVANYFEQSSIEYQIHEGSIYLPEEDISLGLGNIAQLCAQSDQDEWEGILTDHFDQILSISKEDMVPSEMAFEDVQNILMVRIWPEEAFDSMDEDDFVHRQDLPNTVTVLVIDMPTMVLTVDADAIDAWGWEPEDLFQLAIENTYNEYHALGTVEVFEEDIEILVHIEDHFFVSTQALMIDKYPRCMGDFGSLIGIPARNVFLCYPIHDAEAIEAIHFLIPIIQGIEQEGPGSVSPDLYWYDNGSYIDLPYSIETGTLEFFPPDDFIEVLNVIGE